MNFDALFEGNSFDELDALIDGMETPDTVFTDYEEEDDE